MPLENKTKVLVERTYAESDLSKDQGAGLNWWKCT